MLQMRESCSFDKDCETFPVKLDTRFPFSKTNVPLQAEMHFWVCQFFHDFFASPAELITDENQTIAPATNDNDLCPWQKNLSDAT